MKNLTNLKQLISYCLNCPICSKERHLAFEGDSSRDFTILSHSFSLKESVLELNTSHRYESFQRAMKIETAEVKFKINCETHSYSVNIKANKKDIAYIKDDIPNLFYFYIYAHCPNCSSLDTVDLEIQNGKFGPAGIERETFRAMDGDVGYHAEFYYKDNKMMVKTIKPEGISKPMTLPIYELDLSAPDDLAAQIKNIIAFS